MDREPSRQPFGKYCRKLCITPGLGVRRYTVFHSFGNNGGGACQVLPLWVRGGPDAATGRRASTSCTTGWRISN